MLDLAVELDVIQKAGAWFSYNEARIGQGRDNAKEYLKNNPDVLAEVEDKIREKMKERQEAARRKSDKKAAPVEIPIAEAPKMTAAMAKASIDIVVDDEE